MTKSLNNWELTAFHRVPTSLILQDKVGLGMNWNAVRLLFGTLSSLIGSDGWYVVTNAQDCMKGKEGLMVEGSPEGSVSLPSLCYGVSVCCWASH